MFFGLLVRSFYYNLFTLSDFPKLKWGLQYSMHHALVIESNELQKKLFLVINVYKYWSIAFKNRIFIQMIGMIRTGDTRYYRYWNIINYKVILFFCTLLLTHGDIEANPRPTKKRLITFHAVTGIQTVF